MGLRVDPNQIVAQANSLVQNFNEYFSMANNIRSSMNYVISNCTSEGKAITAVKNQAEAHIVALNYFELIAGDVSKDGTSLKNAVASNEITEVLDEETLLTLIQNSENTYSYYCDRIAAVQSFDFSLNDIGSYLLSLVVDFERARDNALELKQKYEKKLQALRNFEAQTAGLFQGLSDHIHQQDSLLNELSWAGTNGKFPSTALPMVEKMKQEYEEKMPSPDSVLFYRDKNGRKHINESSLALFTDIEEEDMTPFLKKMRQRVVEYVFSHDCTIDELNIIIKAFYDPVEKRKIADEYISVSPLKNNAKGFEDAAQEVLLNRINAGKSTKDNVSRSFLIRSLFDKANCVEFTKVSNEGDTYKVSYKEYKLVNSRGEYTNGKWKPMQIPEVSQEYYTIKTFGHGDSGALAFYSSYYKEMCTDLKLDAKDNVARSMYTILLNKGLGKIPGFGTAYGVGKDLLESVGNDYKAQIAINNGLEADNAIVTDCYITMVEDKLVSTKGPNTDTICKYMDDHGYPLKGNRLKNAKTINQYGKSLKLDTVPDICNYIQIHIKEEGYEWVNF